MPRTAAIARAKREMMARLILTSLRMITEEYLQEPRLASVSDVALLLLAIRLAQLQGRPLTPAKAAQYVGIPRATALRKLKDLEARGLVSLTRDGNCLMIPEDRLGSEGMQQAVAKIERMIHETSAALSKMDTRTLASRPVPDTQQP